MTVLCNSRPDTGGEVGTEMTGRGDVRTTVVGLRKREEPTRHEKEGGTERRGGGTALEES